MASEHQFSEIIEALLHEVTPKNGATALLLRHPIGNVYFPLGFVVGEEIPIYADELLKWYFLYSTKLESSDHTVTLTDTSPIQDIVLKGKLAVEVFPKGPVELWTDACDASREVVLYRLKCDSASRVAHCEPSENIKSALAACVATWRSVAEKHVQLSAVGPSLVAASVTDLLTDHRQDPPYFPVLYAAVDCKEGTKGGMTPGRWRANALSHNCYLLENCERLVTAYIHDMVCRTATEFPYTDDEPAKSRGLPAAIASACADVVHRIAAVNGGAMTVFARRNVPRSEVTRSFMDDVRQLQERTLKSVSNPWHLLRNALQYLKLDHDDSALVTAWLGCIDNTGSFRNAIPIGFVPGGRVQVLERAAKHKDIEHLLSKVETDDKRIAANVIMLGPDDPKASSPEYFEPTLELVKSVISRAAAGIRSALNTFPGPYELDFQNCADESPLIITSLANPGPQRKVCPLNDKEMWEFLRAICEADRSGMALVTHKFIQDSWSVTGSAFAESIKQKLKGTHLPIEWKYLFKNAKGRGYAWVGDSSRYKRLSSTTYLQVVDEKEIDAIDTTKRKGQRRKPSNVDRRED